MPTPDRENQLRTFLSLSGWDGARRQPLAGDASARRYERLTIRAQSTAILMDAAPGQADDVADFVRIGAYLNSIGLSAPAVLAKDLMRGFLLLEDLGDDLFARLATQDVSMEAPLYSAATDVLIHLQAHDPAPDLTDLAAEGWADAAALVLDWYRYAITGDTVDQGPLVSALGELISTHADGRRVMILRDYHAENLLWLPQRTGLRRVGLLDFQMAQRGQPTYDLVSLLQDARRDVSPATEAAMIARFVDAAGISAGGVESAYAVLGAQRALRILGVFARLCLVSGKTSYIAFIPRVWGYLQRNMSHPAMAGLAAIYTDLLPPPTHTNLQRIVARCGTHPAP